MAFIDWGAVSHYYQQLINEQQQKIIDSYTLSLQRYGMLKSPEELKNTVYQRALNHKQEKRYQQPPLYQAIKQPYYLLTEEKEPKTFVKEIKEQFQPQSFYKHIHTNKKYFH